MTATPFRGQPAVGRKYTPRRARTVALAGDRPPAPAMPAIPRQFAANLRKRVVKAACPMAKRGPTLPPWSIPRGVTQMARKKNRRAAPMSVQARYEFAVAYLNAMLEDAAPEELTAALGRIARAAGGPKLAEKVELSADSLYRTLCRRGNPELRSATVLLKAMGMRLVLERIPMAVARPGSTPVSPCPSGSR